jgi:2-polyprenyl-6-methoxyphenol hydroxylase-like FAD-dependent oxidoreductase
VIFTDGSSVQHDLIVGADGIGSAVRKLIGIQVEKRPADSSCLHANVTAEEAVALGLPSYGELNSAIEYWGGHGMCCPAILAGLKLTTSKTLSTRSSSLHVEEAAFSLTTASSRAKRVTTLDKHGRARICQSTNFYPHTLISTRKFMVTSRLDKRFALGVCGCVISTCVSFDLLLTTIAGPRALLTLAEGSCMHYGRRSTPDDARPESRSMHST